MNPIGYSFRRISRSLGSSVMAIATIAMAIGINLATLSVVQAVLFKSLGVPQPERLINYSEGSPTDAVTSFSNQGYEALLANAAMKNILAWKYDEFRLQTIHGAEKLDGAMVSGNAFSVLGIKPEIGQFFTRAEDTPGGGKDGWVAVLGYGYWRTHFDSDPEILGHTLVINNIPVHIIGVLPREFTGVSLLNRTDIVLPRFFQAVAELSEDRLSKPGYMDWYVIGRLPPGTSMQNIQANLRVIEPAFRRLADPEGFIFTTNNYPHTSPGFLLQVQDGRLGIGFASSALRFPLFAVESFSVFLFLACCCNLVLLFVGRARREAHSAAIRFAFGARIASEIRFAVVEVSILAAAGCALSIPIAWSAAHFISRAIQSMPGFDTMETISPSTTLTLEATAILFLAAWLAVAGISVWNSQNTGGAMLRTGSRPATMPTNAWMIGFEVFASILLISASFTGFLGFQNLTHLPSGFSSEGTVLASLDMEASSTGTGNNSGQVTSKETRILDRITHSPGVQSVATINVAPLTGGLARDTIAARGEDGSLRQQTVWPAEVSDQYFSAIGTSILRGRGFTHDDTEGEKICVVSRRAASSLFGSRNPLGEYLYHIATGAEKQPPVVYCRVVGVADNAHFTSMSDPANAVVYRLSRRELPNLVVRAQTSGLAMAAIRSAAEAVDTAALVGDMNTIQQNIDDDLRLRKVITESSILSAGVAALILGIGFFGILSIQVAQRKREIGIQIAIGASQVQICFSLMQKFRRAVVLGLATGSGLALIASENLAEVYGLESRYAIWGYIGSLVFLGVLLTVAAFVPLMRALAISPMECLSSE